MEKLCGAAETVKVNRCNERAQGGQIKNHRLANLINDFKTAHFYGAAELHRLDPSSAVTEAIMLLMQYRFDLDNDHDMAALRERIAVIGSGFNSLDGLMQKAFLVSSVTQGRPNRYSPFYVWQNDEAMRAFLLSDAFARVCAKYGRPEVPTWIAIHSKMGDPSKLPQHATQEFISVDPSTDLMTLILDERVRADAAGHEAALHSIHIGLDTTTWQLIRTCFWHQSPDTKPDVDTYDVEYLAFPRNECRNP